jgi:hypothetical protein
MITLKNKPRVKEMDVGGRVSKEEVFFVLFGGWHSYHYIIDDHRYSPSTFARWKGSVGFWITGRTYDTVR